jgi:acyl-CoA thioesterase-2
VASPDPGRCLADVLRVERVKDGLYRAALEGHGPRAFGGDALARAALAAAADCEGKALHALHACFLAAIPGERSLQFHVDPLSDGRRLARRRVQLRDGERLLCELVASFAAPGDGATWPGPTPQDDIPPPEALPSDVELARSEGWGEENLGPVEMRRAGPGWPFTPADPRAPARWLGWVRPRTPLPDDPRAHLAALVYLSDWCSHWGVEKRLGPAFEGSAFASLDHALWLHGPARWDDWLRIETASDVAAAGRALTRRTLHARDGRPVASVAQEAILGGA